MNNIVIKSSRVLYTGAFRFPEGDAAAKRVLSIAKLLTETGLKVDFAGWEAAREKNLHYQYQDYDCYSMSEFRETDMNILRRIIGFLFMGHKTLRWIWANSYYDIIIVYNPTAIFALGLLIMGKIRNFKLVLDNTEWYESEHLPGGRFGIVSFENWLRMRFVYPKFKNIICISKFLESYYVGRNLINIPPLLLEKPLTEIKSLNLTDKIYFLYAGNAGKKDKLLPFIAALPEIKKRLGRNVLLQIAGVDWKTLAIQMSDQGLNPDNFSSIIKCHGKVKKEKVLELYRESHFSILFRENKRYACAGFPTKVIESWSMGCPVIMNPVGDIAIIASNMKDSVFVDIDCIESNLPTSLASILDNQSFSSISTNCRVKASEYFLASKYKSSFQIFIKSVNT